MLISAQSHLNHHCLRARTGLWHCCTSSSITWASLPHPLSSALSPKFQSLDLQPINFPSLHCPPRPRPLPASTLLYPVVHHQITTTTPLVQALCAIWQNLNPDLTEPAACFLPKEPFTVLFISLIYTVSTTSEVWELISCFFFDHTVWCVGSLVPWLGIRPAALEWEVLSLVWFRPPGNSQL